MAAVNLHDLCNNLTSGQVRPRLTALNDLQRILKNEDASSRFKDEVAYSGLLETLTRNFSIELAGFRKSNSAQATSLLQLSADCFRATVEKARLVITKSTVKLLLNHIHDSLPNSGQPGYSEVAARFFAALKAITSHPPHVEQMTKDMWQKTEELCRSHVDVINVYNLNAANDVTAPEHEELPVVEIRSYLPMRRELGDLLFSLQGLYTFPGAPFYGVEEVILTFLLNFLASYDTVSESRMSAIIALNRLLEHITVNKIELTTRACSNIVHLSSKIWEVRISGFKDRILIALAFIFPHLHESAAKYGINSGLRTRIENLLETIRGDFRIQEQKVGLLLDDLVLATLPPQSEAWKSRPFQFVVGPFFSLNPYSKTAELPWLSFQIQSGFIYLLDLVPKQSSHSNGDPHPKRRRLSPNLNLQKLLHDILRFKGQHVTSLMLLQRLAFYLNSFRLSTDLIDISEIVNYLENISDENNTELVGWSFVCMLAILGRTSPSGVTASKSEQWTRIWVSCLKQAALPATCRSACAVMEAIVSKDIMNVRSLLPHLKPIMDYVEQRGPGLLADNSCAFWNALLYKLEDLGISTESLRHDTLMRWMRFRWDAHGTGEAASRGKRLSNIALPCLRLFSSQRWKSGCQIDFIHIQSTPLSVVGQALHCISSNLRLLNFLLESKVEWETPSSFANKSKTDSNITPKGHLEDVLRESFNSTSGEISRLTNSRQVADALAVSQDDIFWFVSVAMLSRLILPPSENRDILRNLTALLTTLEDGPSSVDTCLRAIHPFVQLSVTKLHEYDIPERAFQNALRDFYGDAALREFVEVLCRLSGKFESTITEAEIDMDFKGLQLQFYLSAATLDDVWAIRDIGRSPLTTDSWRMRLLVHLHTETHLSLPSPCLISQHYFRAFETQNLLLAGDIVSRTLFWGDDDQTRSESLLLLESFKVNVASSYDWGGNEMTANAVMSLVSSYISRPQERDVSSPIGDAVVRLYRWAVKVAGTRELSSPKARIRTAALLREISTVDIEYGRDGKSESRPGVILIKLIKDPDNRVKFDVANHITQTFLQFPFENRVEVYRDMVDSLESDEAFTEGFALRAYSLMQLAFASDDIRRAAMVNLLELGKFESCTSVVHSCFNYLAARLYQHQLQNLFMQNRSQFICSWIAFEEDIFQFPIHIFGFPDFHSWSWSVKDELIAQLLNADHWDVATNLFRSSNRFEDVVIDSLPRIVSYYFLKKEATTKTSATVLDRCKAILGEEIYRSRLESRFATCLAVMAERLNDKTLSKAGFDSGPLSTVFAAIALSDPGPTYPEPPEPSFPIRTILTAIENLRRSLDISSQHVWAPPNIVFVVRHLFDLALAASDTTVVLSVLRRIAFVLCLILGAKYEGYLCEMLIFGLIRFIGNVSVSREAIQLLKHVFSKSTSYFRAQPDRFRQMISVLLPSLQNLRSIDLGFSVEVFEWLEQMVGATVPGHACLQTITLLLHVFTNDNVPEVKTVGEIIDALIAEDRQLWTETDLREFALTLLSFKSTPSREDLSTLHRLVPHFVNPDMAVTYPESSKQWLGLAIGRISREMLFLQPEFRYENHAGEIRHAAGDDDSSGFAVLEQLHWHMHLDPTIAGLLEQVLRDVSSGPRMRLSTKPGIDQITAKYLTSPHLESNCMVQNSFKQPPPSDINAWTDLSSQPFSLWYRSLACSIAQNLTGQLYISLVPSIEASPKFCHAIFPYLIDEYRSRTDYDASLTEIFNRILRIGDTVDEQYPRLIISIILFLRQRSSHFPISKRRPMVDDIDYLHASNAAVGCNMYKTALMFLEISGKQSILSSQQQLSDSVLSAIYRNIDDPDMTYALSQNIDRSWNQLLDVFKLHHDREMIGGLRQARLRGKVELGISPSPDDEDLRAVADMVRQNGFPLRSETISGVSRSNVEDEQSSVGLYKSAWRLGIWELPPIVTSGDTDTLIYTVLFHLGHATNTEQFFPILNSAIVRLVDRISLGFDSTENAKAASCLSMFGDITQLLSSSKTMIVAGRDWTSQILRHARYGSYEELEPSASLHNAIFKILESRTTICRMFNASLNDCRLLLIESFLKFCEMTRLCGNSDDLLSALAKTGFLEQKFDRTKHSQDVFPAVLAERAEILWKRDQRVEGIQTLRSLIDGPDATKFSFRLVPKEIILAKLASWTSEMRLSPSDAIVHEFLEPATRILSERAIRDGETAGKVFFEFAQFCTSQLEDQHGIEDAKRMEGLHKAKQDEAQAYSKLIKTAESRNDKNEVKRFTKDYERALKLQKMDKTEWQRLVNLQQILLKKAVENYLRCFSACAEFDHYVPKFCALWLKHSKQKVVNGVVADGLGLVPSYKFLSLMHQLCSRLSTEGGEFQDNLGTLLSRLLHDHPYHSLHQIFNTISSGGDSNAISRANAAQSLTTRMDHRRKIGEVPVNEISVRLYQQFTAYSELANTPVDKKQGTKEIQMSMYPSLRKFRSNTLADLHLPPPSLKLPVSHDRRYADILYIQKYHHSFRIAGGVNQPKILDSVVSNGNSFRELVKGGGDDLHQDAIMQQIFEGMDGVMQRNRETRRRRMRIRTYKVVPLKPQTGVIEWVLDTIPLLEYLDQTHHTIHPKDWKWSVCRQKIFDAAQSGHQERLRIYQNVCEHFKPVLRHFFLEFFKDPDSWLSRRISYSRSVAASSMIGHVLGLGDRHGQNILLDTQTGEVVHIDLGVAFEQGKMLAIPEIVPFRLTRDIVDGFGISGCEGTFVRTSTFALSVFREEEDTILTFLDVLKHDPLYNWTLSPLKKLAVQQEMQSPKTKMSEKQPESGPEMEADRAIQLVKRKLSSRLSAEADVRRLILEATDEGNLSRMYCGWGAFA